MEKELLAFVACGFVLVAGMIGGVGCASIRGHIRSWYACLRVGRSGRLERECAVVLVHVTRVVRACLVADKEPSETTPDGFDKVPWVETFAQGLESQKSSVISDLSIDKLRIVGRLLCLQAVWLPWESEEVKNGEESHFNTEKEVRDTDLNILIGQFFGYLDRAGR